jgi:hypothetical protein
MTRLVSLLVLVSALACASGATTTPGTQPGAPPPTSAPTPPVENPTQPGEPPDGADEFESGAEGVGVRQLVRLTQSGLETSERIVIRSQDSLAAFWPRLGDGSQPPPVDFTRELVLAASMGQRPTGGHSIAVGRTALRDGVLTIEVMSSSPDPGCTTTQSLTQPVDVVAIEAANVRSWRFVERAETQGCG